MFSREEAKARLESAEVPKWLDRQQVRIARLPGRLRPAAAATFNRRSYLMGYSFDSEIEEWLEFTEADRRKVFEAAAPGRGDVMERTWQLCDRLPYPVGWARRPFRVPDRPEIDIWRRVQAVRGAASALARYKGDIAWFAAWASHLPGDVSVMLASEIDGGPEGKATLSALLEIIEGTHPFGAISRSGVKALLTCDKPQAWEAVERLVIAAQRQEGIRQTVFEAADEVHPEAFRRLVRLVVDDKLTRFASVVRSFGVWLGLAAEVTNRKQIDRSLALVADIISDRAATDAAVASTDPDLVYAGLWCHAFNDASGACASAEKALERDDPNTRLVATYLLAQAELPESRGVLRRLLQDSDRTVAALAFAGLAGGRIEVAAYNDLESYLGRLDKERKVPVPMWEWMELKESPSAVLARMLGILQDRHPVVLHEYVGKMNADTRGRYVRQLVESPMTAESRRALVDLVTDRSQWVTSTVFKALHETGIAADEAPVFEKLLTRKSGAARSAAISMLASQSDTAAVASAQRLIESGTAQQRLGGLELLRHLKEANRATDAATRLTAEYPDRHTRMGDAEVRMLGVLVGEDIEKPTLDDGLGLFDPVALTVPTKPAKQRIKVSTSTHLRLLSEADALVEQYRDAPVIVHNWAGAEEKLYGDQRWGLHPRPGEDREAPLGSIWSDWWQKQAVDLFDLERCLVAIERHDWQHHQSIAKKGLPTRPNLDYTQQVDAALWWLWREHGTAEGLEFLLAGYENALTMVPKRHLRDPMVAPSWGNVKNDWRGETSPVGSWSKVIHTGWALRPDLENNELLGRRWQLENWLDRPDPRAPRYRPSFELLLAARAAGWANDTDLLDHLIGPRGVNRHGYGWGGFDSLRETTRRRRADSAVLDDGVLPAVETVRDRVIEVELLRGDVATAASRPALVIRSVAGADRLIELMQALGKGTLVRGWSWNADQKNGVLSHLIRASHPAETDTPVLFAELTATASIPEKRRLELALYAPQWSRYVEHSLGWPGLEDAVFWLHAHTKDDRWSVDSDVRGEWAAEIASRTPLSAIDLVDGGVDVAWFRSVLDTLGEERWQKLLKFVKYTSGGGGHKRAEMFGEALRGALTVEALAERMRTKRHQDTVRALGLVPLSGDEGSHAEEVLARYQLFQEFRQGSRKFGSQKQASEKRAVEIGLDNLARTAGHADPVRLQWEMETLEAGDLAHGSIAVEKDAYLLELGIDDLGKAELTVTKDDERLKSVPAKLRKDEDVVALRSRATALRKQLSRVRASLEDASVFGDAFTGAELERLHSHPILRPLLAATLFVLPDGTVGIPADGGGSLRPVGGRKRKIGDRPVRPAHPVDLLESEVWSEWQHSLFVDEIKQPFKQAFRELYVMTAAESEDGKKSLRYAGHQVNPRQAAGLFGSRGWISHPDGYTFKTFHRDDLTASVYFDRPLFTPAEVDGATMYGVVFERRGDYELLDLEKVPARLFSEVMRDLDLVVSVGHIGGVDPEASASTVEMRTALVRETAMLMRLDNVRFSGSHAMVDGNLGNYSIHLGSGLVHRQPGGAVCIIPVGSQHRGRLFLPFADDDPKTAEVVAKTVMLARDDEIKDPTILEQIL